MQVFTSHVKSDVPAVVSPISGVAVPLQSPSFYTQLVPPASLEPACLAELESPAPLFFTDALLRSSTLSLLSFGLPSLADS